MARRIGEVHIALAWKYYRSTMKVQVRSGNQNPSLTFMALTARAADYAVNELERQNL